MNLNGKTFRVAETADVGVVSADTRLELVQRKSRILGRYQGGSVRRGCLVGEISGTGLSFRYAQHEAGGGIHGGRSVCELRASPAGRLQLVEHFTWETRVGSGINIFEEVDP